jgi:CRISPR-associated endonuclease/helicase Cas3
LFFTTRTRRECIAQTRLGKESVVVIPLIPEDNFDPDVTPDFSRAKQWYMRAVSLSRKGVVKQLKAVGIPEGWKKSPLLRNCYPLVLNERQQWVEGEKVRFDDELGVVYERKEDE